MSYLSTQPHVLALLQSAKEHPEQDGPRLVLADFLEEQGDPDRADFLRLQCQIAPGAPPLEAALRQQIEQRLERLEERHGGAWLGSLWRWWLHLAQWHRGLLAVKLPQRIDEQSMADMLPWIDTLLLTVSGRQSLQRIAGLLQRAQVNHLTLELHTRMGESALLQALTQLPESPCLRSLSLHWPIALLERPEGNDVAGTVAAVGTGFLAALLGEMPLCRHLSHLGTSRPFRSEIDALIRGFGVEPVHAEQRLWMHGLSPAVFQDRGGADEVDRGTFVRVEHDVSYCGGDYSSVGQVALVPLRRIKAVGMAAAFRETTGYDPVHIIHYSLDEPVDADGNPIDA